MNLTKTRRERVVDWIKAHPAETAFAGAVATMFAVGTIVALRSDAEPEADEEVPTIRLALYDDQWTGMHPDTRQDAIFERPEATVIVRRFLERSEV